VNKKMNKNAYTKQKFEEASSDPKKLKKLIRKLEKDIEKEVDDVLRKKFSEIASLLQTVGHKLIYNDKLDDLGNLEFDDEETSDSKAGLWFTCLPVVSVDYSKYNKPKRIEHRTKQI
jgi:hypothetical protein